MKPRELKDKHDQFVDAAKLQGESIKVGHSKIANKQYDILKRIFEKAQRQSEAEIESVKLFYSNLRHHQEPNVQLWACAHSLALGVDVADAENILSKLSEDNHIGILAVNAKWTLKMWKEQGYLKF
jgi:hypothetical protein